MQQNVLPVLRRLSFGLPERGQSREAHAAKPKAQRQEQLRNAAAAGQERWQKRCGCKQCI